MRGRRRLANGWCGDANSRKGFHGRFRKLPFHTAADLETHGVLSRRHSHWLRFLAKLRPVKDLDRNAAAQPPLPALSPHGPKPSPPRTPADLRASRQIDLFSSLYLQVPQAAAAILNGLCMGGVRTTERLWSRRKPAQRSGNPAPTMSLMTRSDASTKPGWHSSSATQC